ncbi:DNA polymerase III subunit gamma/tau [Pseudogemmatithrix spongiicola]|uniref:DNA polymerase III subunit gamma/tau n=1 Tax=Pseudogemmatithrix spongiicola TaxID=3062599 RepID=A0AA49JZ75_9BACT|nr:DNA polymerase III subunit gamma/tau [Gemmatimonadaceae bacterium 'strain 138']WKW14543.1 DNA polymerase III subunit gamma/tau [Gemmatimonadaceae bacterium 'strain 318']
MSLALARKYRPRKFADVAVQSHVANTLRNAILTDRVAHAYLFCGPRGTGKTTLARVLAMALNCERRREDREPCGDCPSCQRVWGGGASLDVVEIDAASNRGVDDARDLRERAMYAPSGEDRYKVYIIDEAHMLTREAWNALLKILEEPPPRVVFVFATTEPQKIQQAAAPVLSRVQRFDLRRIGPADVKLRLATVLTQEGIAADDDALGMLARAADGSMRDALSLTDQVLSLGEGAVTAPRVRDALGLVPEDEHLALLDLVIERRAGDVFAAVQRLADHGVDFPVLLSEFAEILRAQLAVVLGGQLPDVSERLAEELPKRATHFAAGDLLRMLSLLVETEPQLKRSGQQQLLFETLLVRCALLDRTVQIEELLRGGGAGGAPSGGSPRSASGPSAGASAGAATARAPMRAAPPVARDAAAPSRAEPASVAAPPPRPAALRERPVAAAPTVADVADVATQVAAPTALEINRVVEHWDAIVDGIVRDGRALLGAALGHATPTAVTAAGVVTLMVDAEAQADLIVQQEAAILAALRKRFDPVTRLNVQAAAADAAPRRLNERAVKADRMAMLRKQSPLLDAAVDALDLELLD